MARDELLHALVERELHIQHLAVAQQHFARHHDSPLAQSLRSIAKISGATFFSRKTGSARYLAPVFLSDQKTCRNHE